VVKAALGYAAPRMSRRTHLPLAIFVVCALVYAITLGSRALHPTSDNHFVHLAQSILHGQLGVVGNRPPGNNDWALYKGTWFVSFPPFPALVIMPAVAVWGLATRDALFWALLAGAAPALLFMLLERLRQDGQSPRSQRENLWIAALFAFGTPLFYTAVQGTVWFSAQVVASILIVLFLAAALDARHPLFAGACIGMLFLTRPPTLLLSGIFLVEALRVAQRGGAVADAEAHPLVEAARFVARADLGRVLKAVALFSLPVVLFGAVQLWLNYARFDDPFVFGHEYLQIRWQERIERWGLFNYHYFSKNFAIFMASLPWLQSEEPHLTISRHGLALWFTSPVLLWILWPKKMDARMLGLALAAGAVAIQDLCYQNSGWVQFAYRFALDYMPALLLLLALGARRFGPVFGLASALSLAVNLFGAITFDRAPQLYDNDYSQTRVFQPD
jgi:hypothetical protein